MYLVNNVPGQQYPDGGGLCCLQLQSVLGVVAHVVAVLLRPFFALPRAEHTHTHTHTRTHTHTHTMHTHTHTHIHTHTHTHTHTQIHHIHFQFTSCAWNFGSKQRETFSSLFERLKTLCTNALISESSNATIIIITIIINS